MGQIRYIYNSNTDDKFEEQEEVSFDPEIFRYDGSLDADSKEKDKELIEDHIVNRLLFYNEDGSSANLEAFQLDLLYQIIKQKNVILSAEMGMGKTYIGIALARICRLLYPDKKIILTCPTKVVPNFKSGCNTILGELVLTSNGTQDQVDRFIKNYESINIFVVTQSFWLNSSETVEFMYNHANDFSLAFYDEADSVDAVGFNIYSEFSRLVPFKVVSNATPVGKTVDLARNLLYTVSATNLTKKQFIRKYVDQTFMNGTLVSEKLKINDIYRDFAEYYINKNRTDIGADVTINTTFHRLFVNEVQRSWISRGMRADLALYSPENKSVFDRIGDYKGLTAPELNANNIPAVRELLNIIMTNSQDKMMVYIKNLSTINKLQHIITMLGYDVYIINGETKGNTKEISEEYNNNPKALILTNIIKGTNLGNTTRIILYGTPSDVMQSLYRSIRGRVAKNVEVDWIYYPEYDYETLESTRTHISNIDVLTLRDTNIIEQIDDELIALKKYTFVPSNFCQDIYDKKNGTRNGFVQMKYPSYDDMMKKGSM